MSIEIPMPTIELPKLKPKPPVVVKSTFKVVDVAVSNVEPTTIVVGGNYLDVIYCSIPLDQLMLSINDGDWVDAESLVPVRLDVEKVSIKAPTPCSVTLLIGVGDVTKFTSRVKLPEDLAKDSTIKRLLHRKLISIVNVPISANTMIFPSNLKPSTYPVVARIYASFDSSGVLSVVRVVGDLTLIEHLNSGSPLNANCAYMFDVMLDEGEELNLMYSSNANVLKLSVHEVF